MLKIGVLGAGHLGRIHLKLIKEIPAYALIGFYDPDPEKQGKTEKELGIRCFTTMESLISEVDVIDIVTPTLSHFDCAEKAIKQKKHVFIEKPLTNTVEEAIALEKLLTEYDVKAQVGHVERFNPAFLCAQQYNLQPVFIESTRIAQYNPRGTDVSVIHDLMIHDLDIILSLIPAEIQNVYASGVPVISDTPDIANARIEFANGFVANVTASRASLKNERKMRLFQKNAYISINFLDKKVDIYKIRDIEKQEDKPFSIVIDPGDGKTKKEISFQSPKVPEVNAIKHELELFARSILENTEPVVPVKDGLRSLKLAHQIVEIIDQSLTQVKL
jgi:predicted dehydrogenase